MVKRDLFKALIVTVCITIASQTLASVASASEAGSNTPSAQIQTITTDDIMWFEGRTEATQGNRVAIKLFAPRPDGSLRLWQRCSFHFSAGATYRCGIDVAPGSPATKTTGRWTAKLFVDGTLVDRERASV